MEFTLFLILNLVLNRDCDKSLFEEQLNPFGTLICHLNSDFFDIRKKDGITKAP